MLLALGGAHNASAAINLDGLGYVTYGDAQSYSLPIANYQYTGSAKNGPYTVDASSGQIKDLTILGTGANGQNATHNLDGMDNAYITPGGNNGASYFTTNPSTSRGSQGYINNPTTNAWDANLLSMKNYLDGDGLVVFFNNNQDNSNGSSSQSLAAWAHVWVTDANNNTLGSFYFSNEGKAYALVSQGGGGTFMGDVTSYTGSGTDPYHGNASSTDFVLSGGGVCVAHNGVSATAPIPVACGMSAADLASFLLAQGIDPLGWAVSSQIDHNLGANEAGYAIIFPELDALMDLLFTKDDADLNEYTLHADIRMGCDIQGSPSFDCGIYNGWGTGLNSGYEQIFISTRERNGDPTDPDPIPEPGTLLLLGGAMLGFAASRRRAV